MANIYLITTFIAASFIYIQYFTGPLNIFSEIFSTRAGLPRFATVSVVQIFFSVSVAFSILISTCIYDRVNFLKNFIVLNLYQIYILGASIANVSRSRLFASVAAYLFVSTYLFFKN